MFLKFNSILIISIEPITINSNLKNHEDSLLGSCVANVGGMMPSPSLHGQNDRKFILHNCSCPAGEVQDVQSELFTTFCGITT